MEKAKKVLIGLTGVLGILSIYGGGVIFVSLFVLFFALTIGLEIITKQQKKSSTKI